MITLYKNTLKIPSWSLPYLVNGDNSGLNPKEIKMVDNWADSLIEETSGGTLIINPRGEEEFFTWNPEFGLACNVMETDVLIIGECK